MDSLAMGLWSQAKLYVLLFVAFTLLAVLSRGRDAFNWSPELRRSAMTNLLILYFGSLNGILYLATIAPLEWSYHALNLPSLDPSIWEGVPFVLKCLIALLVYDVSIYWVHRILHTSWLWPSHAVHHSDPELHFLSWSRGHFTEQIFIAGCLVFTSSWLGFKIQEIFILATIKALHQYYVHSKLDWNHGILGEVIASPQFHRWHHANLVEAYDKNFATIFPFLDRLWGTYYNPGSALNIPTGIEDEPSNDFITQTLYPFRKWSEMFKAHRAKESFPVELPEDSPLGQPNNT